MEDGDTENYHVSSVIQNFVFLCRKVGSIKGYFCRYIINILRLTVPSDIWLCSIEQFTKNSKLNGFLKKSDLSVCL